MEGVKNVGSINFGSLTIPVGLQVDKRRIIGYGARKCFYSLPGEGWKEVRNVLVSNSDEAIRRIGTFLSSPQEKSYLAKIFGKK